MIWVVLLGWYQIALAGARITPYELWFVPVTILFAAPLLGWGVHRVVGMLAAWPWFLGKRLPDSLFAARVMAYETPFLWIFCLYNGCVVTSLTVHDIFWNSPAVRQFFAATLNLPPDVSWIAVGNLALGVIWLWRHHRAIRAVRWSNF